MSGTASSRQRPTVQRTGIRCSGRARLGRVGVVGVVGGAALRGAVDGQLRETADAAAGKLQRADAAAGGVR